MARTCEKPGRAVRFAAPSERPFARHWYTGVRFLDVICERFLNAQKHRSRWSLAKLCSTRGGCPARPPKRQNQDWYTGVRVLDAILERFLSTQKHRSRWSLAELCSPRGGRRARGSEAGFGQGHRGVRSRRGEKLGRNGPDAAKMRSGWSMLAPICGHLCTALVYRGEFFSTQFWNGF